MEDKQKISLTKAVESNNAHLNSDDTQANPLPKRLNRDIVAAISGAIVGALISTASSYFSDAKHQTIEYNRLEQERLFVLTKELFSEYGDATQVIDSNKIDGEIDKNHWYRLNGYREMYRVIGADEAAEAVTRFYFCGFPENSGDKEKDKYYSELKLMGKRLGVYLMKYNVDNPQSSNDYAPIGKSSECPKI